MHDIDGKLRPEPARHAEHLELGLDIEAVAGLDLDGRDAFGEERSQAAGCGPEEVVLARRARGGDRREDAAALLGDVGIGCAVEPLLEFIGAIAAIDEMGVAIDETRRDEAPAAVDREAGRRIRGAPDPGDPAAILTAGDSIAPSAMAP